MAGSAYTTFDIARMLGVYPSTVADWFDSGKLKGFTTPGGHRRIKGPDLLDFLTRHDMPVPKELKTARRPRILIVDDDEQVSDVIMRSLEAAGSFEILCARDGFEAGQLLGAHTPDIMILDLMIPGIDGFRVCSMIKASYPAMHIIAITGFYSDGNQARILEAGADILLPKPLDLEKLCALTREMTMADNAMEGSLHG